jgi:hypothetical protein
MIDMKKYILSLFLALALLAGCAAQDRDKTSEATPPPPGTQAQPPATVPTDTQPQGFLFQAYGQDIYVRAEAAPLLAALPQPKDTFEARSCAFDDEGMETTYFYPGLELTTFCPENGQEWVLSVVLTDDSVTTPEGVYLGGTLEDIKKSYGDDFTQSGGQLTYTLGQGKLIFTCEEEIITGIVYSLIIGE